MLTNSVYPDIDLNRWDAVWTCFHMLIQTFHSGPRQLDFLERNPAEQNVLEMKFILALYPTHSLASSMILWLDEPTFCDIIQSHSREMVHIPREQLVQAFHTCWDLFSLWGGQLWSDRHRRVEGNRELQLFLVPQV